MGLNEKGHSSQRSLHPACAHDGLWLLITVTITITITITITVTISVHAPGVALNLKSHTARVLNAFLPMVHVGTLHSLPATAVWAAHRAPHHAFDTCSAFAAAAVAALCLDQLFTIVFALGALALGALRARTGHTFVLWATWCIAVLSGLSHQDGFESSPACAHSACEGGLPARSDLHRFLVLVKACRASRTAVLVLCWSNFGAFGTLEWRSHAGHRRALLYMDRPARRASSFLQHLLELALLPDFLSALLRHLLLSLQQALEGSPDFLAALLCHLDFLAALLCHLDFLAALLCHLLLSL